MKTKIITVLIGLVFPFITQGQSYNQYFDGADTSASNSIFIHLDTSANNVWQIGPPQKVVFDSAATKPNVIVTDTSNSYPTNNTSSFVFGIDPQLFGFGVLAIQWKQKLDMDKGTDGGIIEFSSDTGSTWENVFNNPYVYNFNGFDSTNQDTLKNGEYAFTGTDSSWKDIWLCFDLSWLSLNDSLIFRFTMKSDSIDNQKEGWLIDNLIAHFSIVHTIAEIEQKKYMKISPNPTSNRIYINTKKQEDFHIIERIELIDVKGDIIQEWGVSPTKFYIDIGDHPNAIYFLRIKTNKKYETFKVLLER